MTSIIHGDAESKFCIDHATFMIFDNYRRSPADLQSESQQALRDVARLWDKPTTANIGVEKQSGFYATLYTPKDGNSCPPTLALRGTVFPDARGIAVAVRVKAWPAFAPERSSEFAYGFAPGYDAAGRPSTQLEVQSRRDWVSELTSQGNWLELFTHQRLNTSVQRRISVVPAPIANFIPADYRSIVMEATLEVWLNRDEGDWATNVLQGIGERTAQYGPELRNAVDDALRIAADFDNQLRITGHSLGGGMASAAALYAKAQQPDFRIWGLGYDSAGVHENTARELGSSRDRASEANVVTRAVEDEVLTSMEKRTDFVPLASTAIRFAGSTMPPPIGTYVEWKGVSPGPIGAHEFAPKWGEMPNLLPLGSQTLISPTGAVATWANFTGILASSRNLADAMDRLSREINRRVEERNMRRAASERAEQEAEELSELEDRLREQAAERQEAAREAELRRARAAEQARANAAEAEAEASESGSIGGFLYNLYDEPRDLVRGAGDLLGGAADTAGDLGRDAADEIGDFGRAAADEIGDAGDAVADGAGDAMDFAYRHTVQYMVEFAGYGVDLADEAGDFFQIIGAVAAYHSDELAAFTFCFGPDRD